MESRILQLISALRASGVRVSLAESTEAFAAVDLMGIQDRQHFRLSLRSTLIKDVRDLPVFDKLFPLFFGSGQPPLMGGDPTEGMSAEQAQMLADALRQFTADLRQRMERLMDGEPLSAEELEALAQMAGLDGVTDLRAQNWMAQRMLQALEFPEVRAALQELMAMLAQLGMDARRLAQVRAQVRQNLEGIQDQIRDYARQRIAENLSERPLAESVDGLMDRPFQALSDAEKTMLQREIKRLAAALRTRIALRQKRAKGGQLDPKATLRASLKYHGVPMEIRHRDKARKQKIVVLCDISTSMRFCSELMLSFLFALQGQVRKTHAFAFIDHLEFISDEYNGGDADRAIQAVLRRMPGGFYNTDLGGSLDNFNRNYLDTLDGRTTLIIVGDGRNNYKDPRLDLFSRLARRAVRTIWLNPEPRGLWFGDSDMPQYAPLCSDVLKVGNLRELAQAVDALLSF